jgi:ParB/RepB/Spo0J family partition protein
MHTLWNWLRRRATTAPRIESLEQLEELCKSDTDRQLWQCLVEGALVDMGLEPAKPFLGIEQDPWRNALTAIQWERTRLVDTYPIDKSRDGLLMHEMEDARDHANQIVTSEINLFISRLFEGKEDMPATKTKKSPDPKTIETTDDVLKRSLKPGVEIQALHGKLATDDELLVAINQAWRRPLVPGPRKYTISTSHPTWQTAIWIDTISQTENPAYSSKGSLLGIVRDLLNIHFVEAPSAVEFTELKRNGKSRSIPHPSTTSTSTPAGILANDPDAIVGPADDERADLGPIEDFLVSGMKDSPYQTRGEPADDWLQELADSMNEEGQLQPCLVRPDGELIGGHTRWRAAQRLKWVTLQVRIVKCDDATARRLVLLDNAKRKDLSDRERCQAYCDLVEEYKVGIDETTLSNIVRLRAIPDDLWAHYEAKCLSIDQMRKLTVHAEREKFVTAFMSHLKAIGCDKEVPETGHFESAFDRGIESCFRPMQKDQYRDSGCLFKPNAIDR